MVGHGPCYVVSIGCSNLSNFLNKSHYLETKRDKTMDNNLMHIFNDDKQN